MAMKIASRKKKIPSIANPIPNASPKRSIISGHSSPSSNESTVPLTAPTANRTATTFDQRSASRRASASARASGPESMPGETLRSGALGDVEDVAVRVLEPGDLDSLELGNPLLGLQAGEVVLLEHDALVAKLAHGGLEVLDLPAGERGRRPAGVLLGRVGEEALPVLERAVRGLVHHLLAQNPLVELPRPPDVAHRD